MWYIIYMSKKKKRWQPIRNKIIHRETCGCNRCFKANATLINKKKGDMDYFTYISSPLWLKRRDEYFKRHKRECKACGIRCGIQLHHLLYKDFSKEKDFNLIALCVNCHKEFHAIFQTTKDLRKQTQQFIALKQKHIAMWNDVF